MAEIKRYLLVLVACLVVAEGAKVLLIPVMFTSTIMEKAAVGETLVGRGHDVFILLESGFSDLKIIKEGKIRPLYYTEPPEVLTFAKFMDTFLKTMFEVVDDHDYDIMADIHNDACSRLFHNKPLMAKIAEFDFILIEGFGYMSCFFLLPHHLNIPYGFMFASAPDLSIGIPALPSFRTTFLDTIAIPQTLSQKIEVIQNHLELRRSFTLVTPDLMREFAPGVASIWEVMLGCDAFIVTNDHSLDEAGPSLPNTLFLPGITTRPAVPLPEHFQVLLDKSSTVVLLSFGSSIENLPQDLVVKLMLSLAPVKDVLFMVRISDKSTAGIKDKIPSNVHTVGWIPQQDILAHPNVKLFITHCGNNGQYEAAYQGVPMVGLPVMADEHHNCVRLETKQLGVCIPEGIQDFRSEDMTRGIQTVLGDKKYARNSKKLSDILKGQRLPRERAADLIEHVIEFGGEHLRSGSQKMTLTEMLMLDVLAVVLLVTVTLSCLVMFCLCKVCGLMCQANKKPKRE